MTLAINISTPDLKVGFIELYHQIIKPNIKFIPYQNTN